MKPDGKYLTGGMLLFLFLGVAIVVIVYLRAEGTDSGPGAKLYQEHCSACHGRDGNGLKTLYPPLAQSPYLSDKNAELACLIRRGVRGSLVTDDGSYNQRMPAFAHLKAADIGRLITFLQKRWGKTKSIIPLEHIERWLLSCP